MLKLIKGSRPNPKPQPLLTEDWGKTAPTDEVNINEEQVFGYVHLVHLPPLGVEVVVDVVGREDLGAHSQHGVGVRLPRDDPLNIGILGCQILSL